MGAQPAKDITALLLEWVEGKQEALNQLTPLIYDELHRLADWHLRKERGDHILQSTGLVHELYIKLVDQRRARWQDREHFFGVASQMIRRILVSNARAQKAAKRGGGKTLLLFDESIAQPEKRSADVLALDEALETLSRLDPQQGRIVELRTFGGLSIEETAGVLNISPATVKRDWKVAKAWLFRELTGPS